MDFNLGNTVRNGPCFHYQKAHKKTKLCTYGQKAYVCPLHTPWLTIRSLCGLMSPRSLVLWLSFVVHNPSLAILPPPFAQDSLISAYGLTVFLCISFHLLLDVDSLVAIGLVRWAHSLDMGLKMDQSLVDQSHNSALTLPQHILQAQYIVSQVSCDRRWQFNVYTHTSKFFIYFHPITFLFLSSLLLSMNLLTFVLCFGIKTLNENNIN